VTATTELRVRVVEQDNGKARYFYELRSTGGELTRPIEQEYSVDVHQSLVRDLVARIDELVCAALDSTIDHRADIAGYAQTLHDTLLPRADGYLPELVTRVAQSTGPLLVRTNEHLIPWELLHDGSDFLGLRRDLGRHAIATRRVTDGRGIAPIRKALIIADTLGDLKAAQQEAEHIDRLLSAHGTECTVLTTSDATLLAVVQQLRSGTHDLLHFCGHVSDGHAGAGLLLHRRELLDDLALQPLAALGVPPLVVINGCASASPTANLCMSFTVMGAKAVVGTRHPVDESCARDFATGFYESLLAGATAGTAIRQGRLGLLDRPSAAWASFALYGDPSLSISATAPAAHRSPGAGDLLAQLPSLTGRGTVTSTHLLYALLTAAELRAFLTRQLGDTRLGMLVELTEKLIAGEIPDDGADRAPVRVSDTVHRILLDATAAATRQGRPAATVADLATAFAETGGGSSRYLLDLCGIAPGLLDPLRQPAAATDLFDDEDRLRTGHLDPAVRAAVLTGLMLARSKRMTMSTEILLLSLGLTGNAVLRDRLRQQGEAGAVAIDRLMPAGPRGRYLSARTRTVLLEAAEASAGVPLDTGTLLRALLADPSSTARRRMEQLGVDVDLLLGPDTEGGPAIT
jgi:hypothetical protein